MGRRQNRYLKALKRVPFVRHQAHAKPRLDRGFLFHLAERPAQAFTICQHTTTTGKPIAERLATIWLDADGQVFRHDLPAHHHHGQAHCRASGYDLA
jgi:hypothetical protein